MFAVGAEASVTFGELKQVAEVQPCGVACPECGLKCAVLVDAGREDAKDGKCGHECVECAAKAAVAPPATRWRNRVWKWLVERVQ